MQILRGQIGAVHDSITWVLGCCRHMTAVERCAAHKLRKRAYFDDATLEILRERRSGTRAGARSTALRRRTRVVEIDKQSASAFTDAVRAMREAADVICTLDPT
jgi:hypothetical protein